MQRWIVDIDGRNGRSSYAVAQEESGRSLLVSPAQTREACEKLIVRLRAKDGARLAASRRRNGERLAARNRSQA